MKNKQTKKMHISFDDVILLFKDLEEQDYRNIFQQRFLRRLKYFHDMWGCKFTLYVFIEFRGITLKNLSPRYMDEISENADWLKFGYHGYSPEMPSEKFIEGYLKFKQFLGKYVNLESHTVRLHRFCASENEVAFLNKQGIQTFLTADDGRSSYDLNSIENGIVNLQGRYTKSKSLIEYCKTNIRLESKLWRDELIRSIGNERMLVIFSHEELAATRFYPRELLRLRMIMKQLMRKCDLEFYN